MIAIFAISSREVDLDQDLDQDQDLDLDQVLTRTTTTEIITTETEIQTTINTVLTIPTTLTTRTATTIRIVTIQIIIQTLEVTVPIIIRTQEVQVITHIQPAPMTAPLVIQRIQPHSFRISREHSTRAKRQVQVVAAVVVARVVDHLEAIG